ncbi:MAG: ABC transporter permease [Anaerolineae bacterium]
MNALLAVYKREVVLYYKSFIAYGITFALMLFMGLLFQAQLSSIFTFVQQGGQVPPGANAANLAAGMLDTFVFLLFVVSPVLAMRLISEEAREGTLEVLMTLPMSDWVFVVGKFLAAWTFYTFLLALTLIHVWLLTLLGPINMGVIWVAYLGAWLYGGTTLAVCMIWSAVTDDQLVAAFLGVTTVLALFLASDLGQVFEGNLLAANASQFVRELGLRTHYQTTMLDGLLRGQDIAYFILMIAVSLFITTLIVGTRRWRAS